MGFGDGGTERGLSAGANNDVPVVDTVRMNRVVGVKSYGFEWRTRFGLSEAEAARALDRQGFDWVIVQNLIDPLPGSAVSQDGPGLGYDDRRFRDALRQRGLKTFEATAVFFQPEDFRTRPRLRPLDARGAPMEPFGWYMGLCPSDEGYLAERAERLEEVVAAMEPDGIFLSFIRFPGFWELWMPETRREDISEYCFCERCLERFQDETGHQLPVGPTAQRAAILQHELRDAWTAWKCGVIGHVVAVIRAAAARSRPGIEVMVNGLAFGRDDYAKAGEEILGQRVEAIAAHAEHLELMFYHQILRRPPEPWIARVTAELRGRTERTLLACLQGKAEYLEPLYAAGRRKRSIPVAEFARALRAVAASPAEGVLVYHWTDFLEDELTAGGGFLRALADFKAGTYLGGP